MEYTIFEKELHQCKEELERVSQGRAGQDRDQTSYIALLLPHCSASILTLGWL